MKPNNNKKINKKSLLELLQKRLTRKAAPAPESMPAPELLALEKRIDSALAIAIQEIKSLPPREVRIEAREDYLTVNEVRAKKNLPPVSGGDAVRAIDLVSVENLPEEIARLSAKGLPITNFSDIKFPEFPQKMEVEMKQPSWWKEAPKSVEVEGSVKINGKVSIQEDGIVGAIVNSFSELIRFLGSFTFKTTKPNSDYAKPQAVMLFDPYTGKMANLREIFTNVNMGGSGPSISVSGGGASTIAIKGASSFGGGTLTVTAAGTRVQLPNIPCRTVTIQSHETNGSLTNNGVIVVGGSNVIAASNGRNGYAIYATQAQVFDVANANMLYVDSTDNGALVTYTYQI